MPACLASSQSSISPASSPFFLVGQDADGHWLAVETHGRGGGLFVSRDAALGYVRPEAWPERSAFQIAETPLDLTFAARWNS